MDKRIKYSIKQKGSIVRSILRGERTMSGAAREIDGDRTTIRRWIEQYKRDGVNGFKFRNRRYEAAF
jgi:transposase-like protein